MAQSTSALLGGFWEWKSCLFNEKEIARVTGKASKSLCGLVGIQVGSQQFIEVPSEQPWSHLSAEPSQHLQPKEHQQNQNVWEQVPAESVTTAAAALSSFFKKTDTKKINCLIFSLIIMMDVFYYFLFKCVKDLPENATVIQIWEMATCFLCDLSQHHCCPWLGGGHSHVQNPLPGFSFDEQSLLLSVEMSQSAMLPFLLSPHTCAVAQCQPGNFLHLSCKRQLWGEGSSVTMLPGSCSPLCVTATGTSLHATAGLKFFFLKKKQNKNHLLFLACCLLVFISQTWKWERRKQLSAFLSAGGARIGPLTPVSSITASSACRCDPGM